ncbi:hydroxyacylglutathione hydrolase [Marinobacterium arenosum]|uniref:hydroxyacylglutathione hydrolase n=1 Tax=Marinobacterium arenosum TaxID=2862496 RepID=UPI001C93C21E|nr:hydroxyacylglutathione hydrolase [Marinobacterium arenosum]MBY4677255.1 hydroxyacylglutathione hydrolase [Marinobacterium arenosum]
MFQVTPIPAFNDNYIWLLQREGEQRVVVVDPGDAAPVERYLQHQQLQLAAILITHHHADHTGGVSQLTAQRDIPVYGPASSPFKGISHPLRDGDRIEVLGLPLQITEVPGHTLDHISYLQAEGSGQLFCGDTLFLAGCGRLFEGSAAQMLAAMHYFKGLPDSCEVYCTHEYSLANLAFAAAVEPDNRDIQQAIRHCQLLRNDNQPTLPSNIATEKRVNPFMRSDQPAVVQAAERFQAGAGASEEAVFAAIREWKNQF